MTTKKKVTRRDRQQVLADRDDPLVDDVQVGREDLPDSDSVAVVRGPEGSALLLPVALRKLGPEAMAAVEELQRFSSDIAAAHKLLREAVEQAREEGLSWDSIGWCVGTTGRAANMRWGSGDPRRRPSR